ncbi:MAG: peptidase, partial [Aquirufa sp.]
SATPNFVAGKYYAFSTADNASFTLLNALLKAGIEVSKSKELFYLAHSDMAASILAKAQVKINVLDKMPSESANKLGAKRIGLWDVYGGSMPSGWLRWILEQHQFDFKLVFAKEIDKGNLRSKFDVLIFVRGAIPGLKGEAGAGEYVIKEPVESEIPAEYQETLGKLTAAKSIPSLKAFLEAGGDIITIGTSANLAYHLNLLVKNALVEVVAGKEKDLPGEKFYIPGSVMQVSVDNSVKANWGMTPQADVYFSASPVFKLSAEAIAHGELIPLAWYASDKTLRSGWAFGQTYLQDGIAAFQAKVGKGNLYVFGPEVTFRGQTHNTFKMVFNQLYETR